ncbi:MAG: pantetheine-phosphate adenylyltransferase [Bacteroidales bacterium]|nr:pantetheine-phosphate adenylyltransferase [Bacteroidales bacterium]
MRNMEMKKIALFPGSFDPITLGHVSVLKRAIPLFDKIIVAIGINSSKQQMFSLEQRTNWIRSVFAGEPVVEVQTYNGLTVDFCKKVEARYILRGLRTAADFEFERGIGQVNRMLYPDLDTVFLLTEPKFTPVSSSIVRDVYRNGGDISSMVPQVVVDALSE